VSYSLRLHCCALVFISTNTSLTSIYTLSLHDALPIFFTEYRINTRLVSRIMQRPEMKNQTFTPTCSAIGLLKSNPIGIVTEEIRSEEHTSELQSRFDLVCRLPLEKKNYNNSAHYLCIL